MLCDGRSKELTAKFAKRTAKGAKKDLCTFFFASLAVLFALFAVMIFLALQIILPMRGV